jgi:hypothetical protein
MIDPSIVTTIRTGELPTSPFSLTDKIAHEVGTDLKQSTIADLIAFISPLLSAIQFEVKTLHVNQTYIDDNFDVTGLGINLMTGYAIVNGNNGTINKDGRVGIAYGTTTNVIGQVGGSDDSVVVSHSHNFIPTGMTYGSGGIAHTGGFFASAGNTAAGGTQSKFTELTGESGVGKNRQRYLVELQVMKL